MHCGDVGVGLALPGVPHGGCETRGWQAVPLRRKASRRGPQDLPVAYDLAAARGGEGRIKVRGQYREEVQAS